ncbi:MAG: hypothetical protein AB4290_08955 [Spirulina sp.]
MRYEGQELRPYVKVEDGDSEAAVKERCKELADRLLGVVLAMRLSINSSSPPWLDRESPKIAFNRIRQMLHALDRVLKERYRGTQKLEELSRLERSPDRRTASTPLLLAIGALLHSHKEWTASNFHDIRSAVAIEKLFLDCQEPEPYPKWIVDKIPRLIALKNIYRNACKYCSHSHQQLPEIGVYKDGKLSFDPQELTVALAGVMKRLFSTDSDESVGASVGADALFCISLAYEARHGGNINFRAFESFTEAIKAAIEHQNHDALGTFTHFEFRRHLLPHIGGKQAQKSQELLECLLNKLFEGKEQLPQTAWISFDRFWAIRHSTSLKEWLENTAASKPTQLLALFPPCNLPTSSNFIQALGCSNFYALELEKDYKDYAFKVAFNCSPNQLSCQTIPDDIWQRISTAVQLFQSHRTPDFEGKSEGEPKFSVTWAYFMQILYVLEHIYPEEFFQLSVVRPDSPQELGDRNIIMLPRKVPNLEIDLKPVVEKFEQQLKPAIQDLQAQIKRGEKLLQTQQSRAELAQLKQKLAQQEKEVLTAIDWMDAKLLTARCLATLLLNQRMAFGNRQQMIQVERRFQKERDEWLKIARWVAEMNRHEAVEKYLTIYLTPKVQLDTDPILKAPVQSLAKIAGFDIGGTLIKATVYEYYPETETLGKPCYKTVKLPTQPQLDWPGDKAWIDKWQGQRYPNAAAFVQRLDAFLKQAWGDRWHEDIVGMGITWPGAISGELGHEYITSYSKSLGYFQTSNAFYDMTADEIHHLDFREAFEEHFHTPVTLINDGVAHVLYHQWQFNREILSVGEKPETVVGLFAGTGSAEAVLSGESGHPLKVLAELGKRIDDIGCPFPVGFYPEGLCRHIFNKDTLPALAKDVCVDWGIVLPFDIPGLLIGWILEKIGGPHSQYQPDAVALEEIKKSWGKEKPAPAGGRKAVQALDELDLALAGNARLGKTSEDFAKEVVKRAGERLADLIAQVRELYGSLNVFTGGGPMSGATGRYIRNWARHELREGYGFDVVGDEGYAIDGTYNAASITHHLTRLIRFPEPRTGIEPPGPSGCRGAAETSLALFGKPPVRIDGSPTFSTFSVLKLGSRVAGKIYFLGKDALLDTAGYVRSRLRADRSPSVKQQVKSVYDPLPWRDYPDTARIGIERLIDAINQEGGHLASCNHIIISARNTINEWGYQVRMQGKWYRRIGDEKTPPDWPVVAISDRQVRLCPFAEAKEEDLVTGIPLAIESKPVSRTFLVANCSDVAHNFDVDPKGRRGPSATAWQALSECWQRAKDEGVPDYVLEQRMDRLANYYEVEQSRHLLHSIIAQRQNGDLLVFATTGALTNIARAIAGEYRVQNAILLDNGGSVGWHSLMGNNEQPTLLVSGPNYRPRGLVFLDLWLDEFVHPKEHRLLSNLNYA